MEGTARIARINATSDLCAFRRDRSRTCQSTLPGERCISASTIKNVEKTPENGGYTQGLPVRCKKKLFGKDRVMGEYPAAG